MLSEPEIANASHPSGIDLFIFKLQLGNCSCIAQNIVPVITSIGRKTFNNGSGVVTQFALNLLRQFSATFIVIKCQPDFCFVGHLVGGRSDEGRLCWTDLPCRTKKSFSVCSEHGCGTKGVNCSLGNYHDLVIGSGPRTPKPLDSAR